MAVKKKEHGKVVVPSVLGTFFSIKQISEKTGYGKARKVTTSSYALCNHKKILYEGFKNVEQAIRYATLVIEGGTYYPKKNTFTQPPEEKWK